MVNPLELSGRTILVTGASSGIGRETACLLSRLGARVVLAGRSPERLTETLRLLDGENHQIETFDLSAVDEICGWLKQIAASAGPLNGLVHSAGVHSLRPLRLLRPEILEDVMRVNFSAAVGLARGYCQKGVCAPAGSIVFLSSAAALKGQAGIGAYAASKGALISAARALAVELAPERIRVNCIAPGIVASEMGQTLLSRVSPEQASALEAAHLLGFGSTRDIAHAIAFLLADTGRWITGSLLVVDGGYTAQ